MLQGLQGPGQQTDNSFYSMPGNADATPPSILSSLNAGAEYGNPGLFTSIGFDPSKYLQNYIPNTQVLSQQRIPPPGWNPTYFSKTNDPTLQYRLNAGSRQTNTVANKWKLREQRVYNQMKFNNLQSGTDTSHVGTREDNYENWAYNINRQPFKEARLNEWIILAALGVGLYFLFKE